MLLLDELKGNYCRYIKHSWFLIFSILHTSKNHLKTKNLDIFWWIRNVPLWIWKLEIPLINLTLQICPSNSKSKYHIKIFFVQKNHGWNFSLNKNQIAISPFWYLNSKILRNDVFQTIYVKGGFVVYILYLLWIGLSMQKDYIFELFTICIWPFYFFIFVKCSQ